MFLLEDEDSALFNMHIVSDGIHCLYMINAPPPFF